MSDQFTVPAMPLLVGPLAVRTPIGVMKKDDRVEGHEHNFDHVTVCLAGAIRIDYEAGGEKHSTEIYAASSDHPRQYLCNIRAGVRHSLTALVDGTQYGCFYAHRQANGEATVEYTGWLPAYE